MTTRRLSAFRSAVAPHLPAIAVLLSLVTYELWPILSRWDTYGFHDWDVATAQRYLTVLSLLRHGEGPWWNPYFCGGFPGFGHPEGTPNLVSPWLPFYLLADMRVALRVEVLGSALLGVMGSYVVAGRFTKSTALRA